MKYNLLFCINHAYTDILLVSLYSIINNSGFTETDVYVISRDLNEQDRRKIRILETEKIRITFIDFDCWKMHLSHSVTLLKYISGCSHAISFLRT